MKIALRSLPAVALALSMPTAAEETARLDYLSLAQGALPVTVDADPALKIGRDLALKTIDGDDRGFVLTPRPGGKETVVTLVYQLPALTTFSTFAIPNVLETPSPSQTFFRDLAISGSAEGPDGPFVDLVAATLTTHPEKGMRTDLSRIEPTPVKWLRVTLRGGIDVQRDKTFFELSEIIGHGSQEPVPLSDKFTGKWKGRGVLLALSQDGPSVSGCYDRTGDLEGTVSGNVLRATGTHRSSGVGSVFVLSLDDRGDIIGVSSTNGAPFRVYNGASAPNIDAGCSDRPPPTPGCGSILHGINFDYDSAVIRPDSKPLLDQLYAAFDDAIETRITIVGHTSSEGSDAYNQELSRRRAEAVVAALVTRGIDASRLAAAGEGEHRPIADNATDAGRSLNRRVEITCQ